jgi:hypothetical protein
MTYTLAQFSSECRRILQADQSRAGLDKVAACVTKALRDEEFIAKYLPEDAEKSRNVLYEDPDLGFCICAHVNKGAKDSPPHDHGPTWAIYGQAAGETRMTDWEVVKPAQNGEPALVKLRSSYWMKPGDAHVYEAGAVHAPYRSGATRLIRIEGKNTDKLERTPIRIAEHA